MTAPATPGPERAPGSFGYVPALDGIRGVALVGVLLFHAGHADGAFLSVDLFFALSGFLITALLMGEWTRSGAVDLKRFWSRRARRLLPAALVVLLVTSGYAALALDPAELHRYRGDALAALVDVANWRAIAVGGDYWESFGDPSPLRHMWTLSVEEQLYVAWPLAAIGGLRLARSRRWGRQSLLVGALAGSALSMVAMAWLVAPGDTSRAYYGTDTRAFAVLLGAAAAVALSGRRWAPDDPVPRALSRMAPVAVSILVLGWSTADGQDVRMYRGGFQLGAVAAAAVVAAVACGVPRWLVGPLELPVLRWLGRVSYGAYLWHWPIFVVVDEAVIDADLLRTAVRLGTTFVAAAASAALIERPVREGRIGTRAWRVLAPAALVGVAGATLLATTAARPRPSSGSLVTASEAEGVRSVLLVGDSEAFELGEGAEAVAGDLSVTTLSFFGCGIGPGIAVGRTVAVVDDGQGTPCPEVVDRFVAAADAEDPDVVLLHVGGFEIFDRQVGGREVRFGSGEWDRVTERSLVDTLGRLGAGGRRVVALASPCFAPRLVDDGTLQLITREQAEEINEIRSDQARVVRWNDLLRAAAAETGASVVPYDELFCGVAAADQPSRPDGVHLDDAGAREAWRWILPALEEQLRR